MRLAFLATLAACTLGLAACANYHLGTGAEPRFSTLHVSVVRNETLAPQVVALVTTQVREAFIKDGRVRLVDSADEADATLSLVLEDYHRDATVARADDTGLARRFDVTLQARATLHDRRAQRDIFTRQALKATRGVFTDSGQIPSEYHAAPLLAELLAERALHAVLDNW